MDTFEDCIKKVKVGIFDNQEDSLIFNKTSIQRGKFAAMSIKKYILSVQKNQSTAQDDILTKPDPTKVSNMKQGSYDKLNDKGYVEPEKTIEYEDAIFGMITPVTDNVSANSKPYRDKSEIYKVRVPGVIDRVYLGTSNQDGYETRKASVRSQREPKIGDKYCCYSHDTELLTESGWKYFKDLKLTDKVATLVDGDILEYRNISHVHEYDHDGKMYSVKNNNIDLLVTLNHRMYIKEKGCDEYCIKEAKDIIGKNVDYIKNVKKSRINCTMKDCKKAIDNTFICHTKSISEANDMQILCLHAGYSCNIKNVGNDTYELIVLKSNVDNEPISSGESIVEYKDKVYCCTLEKDDSNLSNGTLYVRRNGIPIWSCNSQHGRILPKSL
jgi:hypothetical protein